MRPNGVRTLLIGYGNPGRLDDGLGPALAAHFERLALPGLTVEADYQLTVEDAALVAEHDVAIFADAAVAGPAPFELRRIDPQAEEALTFSTHSVSPAGVLALARTLFHAETAAYTLAIRGYRFDEFGEELSEQARANLTAAVDFLQRVLDNGGFSQSGAAPVDAAAPARSDGDA